MDIQQVGLGLKGPQLLNLEFIAREGLQDWTHCIKQKSALHWDFAPSWNSGKKWAFPEYDSAAGDALCEGALFSLRTTKKT